MKLIIHEREEWLAGYQLRPNEGSAWRGGNTFPRSDDINNVTWHDQGVSSDPDPALQLRADQAAYHTRIDGQDDGRPAPLTHGTDLGYNVSIDLNGEVWKIRWTDMPCAANGGDDHRNRMSFAVQFMTAHVDDDLTAAQLASARWLDGELHKTFPTSRLVWPAIEATTTGSTPPAPVDATADVASLTLIPLGAPLQVDNG